MLALSSNSFILQLKIDRALVATQCFFQLILTPALLSRNRRRYASVLNRGNTKRARFLLLCRVLDQETQAEIIAGFHGNCYLSPGIVPEKWRRER